MPYIAYKPAVMVGLIENAVLQYRDEGIWEQNVEQEEAERRRLEDYAAMERQKH